MEPDEDENAPLDIPPEYRSLTAPESRATVRDVWEAYCDGHLALEPDFQRHYVWDSGRASRYIESLMLGLPTPPLFLAEEESGKARTVIDGHQRLETIFRFMQPLLQGPAAAAGQTVNPYGTLPPLRLGGLKVLNELSGKRVVDLSREDRQRLWDSQLTEITLPRSAHPDLKFELFARLNQGSMSLNSQELRNCLYRGPYTKLIARLSEEARLLKLRGRTEPDKRMKDRELAVAFFALLHRSAQYRVPFREFLNDEMRENQYLEPAELERFREEIDGAATWVERVFADQAARLFYPGGSDEPAGRWSPRRQDLVYLTEMVSFAREQSKLDDIWASLSDRERELYRLGLRHRLIDVMAMPRFTDTLYAGTTRPDTVRTRLAMWTGGLTAAMSDPRATIADIGSLHESLATSKVCSLCPTRVEMDDGVLAIVEGKPSLMHRFCETKARNGRKSAPGA